MLTPTLVTWQVRQENMALLLYLKLCLVQSAGGMQAESEDLGFRVQNLVLGYLLC